MKFHNIHGVSVTLSEGKTLATRSNSTFCYGVAFSDTPIKVNQKACLEVTTTASWSGALRVGLTTQDPSKLTVQELPRYAYASFSKRDGFWMCPISETVISSGCKITLYLSSKGQLQLFVDNTHKGACLAGIPVDKPLWLIVDLYGNTKSAKFVKADDAPKEILARGPHALRAYEEACASGTRAVYRTRLLFVGQDRVGKTSLKRALTGQRHNENEERTDGIDLSASCSFSMSNQDQWRMALAGDNEKEADNEDERRKLGIMGGVTGLEEEYHQALAENIIKELVQQNAKKNTLKARSSSRDSIRSTTKKHVDRESIKSSSSSSHPSTSVTERLIPGVPAEMLSEVPDRVVQLVQEMLDQGQIKEQGQNKEQGQGQNTSTSATSRASAKLPPKGRKTSVSNKSSDQSPQNDAKTEPKSTMTVTLPEKRVILNIWDFSGKAVYFTTHQVFLTSRGVYVIVFNLCDDLHSCKNDGSDDSELSTLEYMDFWMRSIYAHASQNTSNAIDNTRLSPPIFVVGTHRNSLSPDKALQKKIVEEKFDEIRAYLMDKPYTQHLVTPFLAVENNVEGGEDEQITRLRKEIQAVAGGEPYMGEQIPIRWLKFEQEVANLVEQGTNHASYDQITEIANDLGISDEKEVRIMLDFYHDLGILIYYGGLGTMDNVLRNTVVLNPQWLIDMFRRVIDTEENSDKWSFQKEKWRVFAEKGILDEVLLDHLWKDVLGQKLVLIGLMEKFDLLCPCQLNEKLGRKSFYVPARLNRDQNNGSRLYADGINNCTFYIDFNGFLPEGLFHRIQTRTIRWTLEQSQKEPYCMLSHVGRFYLDAEHDFILEMAPRKYHRIKVVVMRVLKMEETDSDEKDEDTSLNNLKNLSPKPHICAKLRNFLESTLLELKESWMKRVSYKMCVDCLCGRPCYDHGEGKCQQEECLHFLDLDECLANRVVCCDHRRVKTSPVKKWFPEPQSPGFHGQVLPAIDLNESSGNIEKHSQKLPVWVKGAAKLLNAGDTNQDWIALAHLMGYKEKQVEKFTDDLNPGLALLADWIITSGNTALSVDMLVTYLEKMDRDDIVEVILKENDPDVEPPQVFVSYQWDCQDDVKALRDRLEKYGFTCWMDVGQMGGGDILNAKIDQGIRNAKVILACITPKYVVSHHCNKELGLADLLSKPVIPIMFEEVPWPPPGGMSLILSQYVYINMKGVGGHGGTGIHADIKDKYTEIIQKLMNFVVPDLTKYFDNDALSSRAPSQNIDDLSITSDDTVIHVNNVAVRTPRQPQSHAAPAQNQAPVQEPGHAPLGTVPPQQPPQVSTSCVCVIL
ncbi:hypothetical protein FSP39_001494 [Pinctada imbricata]|uniref:non-specific serine/threonine protein kinase n=1 Tax=Pinctada imbricata TaxID=66713 RepID=A0AA88XND4_PINIB|nr:hypothetical protein FSP39_001494 [Pinctada imbricata]